MKRTSFREIHFMFLLAICIPGLVHSQAPSDTAKAEDKSAVTRDVDSLEERRAVSQMFFSEMQIISTPSTVSGTFITNWEFYDSGPYYKRPFILNADVQLPIALGGRGWYWNNSGLHHMFHVIPQFKVRILDEDPGRGDSSLPVRTPSYMPRLTYYGSHRTWLHETWLMYYGFSAFHHSNGQDGPEFIDSSRANQYNIVGDVNRYNGNFGENCVFEIMFGGMIKSDTVNKEDADNTLPCHPENLHKRYRSSKHIRDYYVKTGFEFHPKKLTNQDLMQYNLYSRYRINLQLGIIVSRNSITELWSPKEKKWYKEGREFPKELIRVILDANFLMGKLNTGYINNLAPAAMSNRINVWLTGHARIPGTKMASGFVQVGYWGSDNYNIYFSQRLIMIQCGLSFGYYRYDNTKENLELRENSK